MIELTPINECGPSRHGDLYADYETICETLGFKENADDDPDKVEASWGFHDQDGRKAFIWCYKTSKKHCTNWSIAGDKNLLRDLFGREYIN